MFYDTSWGHLTSFSCHLQIICRFVFQANDHFISPRVCKPVVIHPSYLTTMANFVPPSSSRPIIEDCPDIGPAFCPRMVLRPEDELAGGWRASSGLRGSTGIAARDEVDLGAEHSTGGGGERERDPWDQCVGGRRRRLISPPISADVCDLYKSLLISADLCWSVYQWLLKEFRECLAPLYSRLHWDKFLLVSFCTCYHLRLSRLFSTCTGADFSLWIVYRATKLKSDAAATLKLVLRLIQNLNPYCCRCRCWCWYWGWCWCQSCECFAAFNCQSNDVYWGRKKGEGANQPHLENLHLPKANAKYISKLTANTFWHFEIWDKYKQTTSTEGVEGANQLQLENLHIGKAFKCKNWGFFGLCPKGFEGSTQKLQKWHWEEKRGEAANKPHLKNLHLPVSNVLPAARSNNDN